METVIIRRPEDVEAPETVDESVGEWPLRLGESATFGRAHGVDVRFPQPDVSRLAGRITATGTYWLIDNGSAKRPLIVENLEGGGEFVRVPPLRQGLPVPFELARIVLSPERTPASFLHVYAPEHRYGADTGGTTAGTETSGLVTLNHAALYFLVLVALCEPRLRDSGSVDLPGDGDIAQRLTASPVVDGTPLSPRAVQFHIDYVARHKLRVADSEDGRSRAHWRRARLADVALKWGFVTPEHLALLPKRPVPGRNPERHRRPD